MKRFTIGLAIVVLGSIGVTAQSKPAAQKIDADYTAKIKESLQDPRITTSLSITCRRRTSSLRR